MASSDERNATPTSTSVEAEIQEDLRLYGGSGWGKNATWFALSTMAHVLILGLLATLTLTITQKRDEMIKVKTLPFSAEEQQQAQADEDDDWEGEPSLKDLPGLLTMEELTPKQAKTSDPPPPLGAPAPIQKSSLSAPPPVMQGLGPMTIAVSPGTVLSHNLGMSPMLLAASTALSAALAAALATMSVDCGRSVLMCV